MLLFELGSLHIKHLLSTILQFLNEILSTEVHLKLPVSRNFSLGSFLLGHVFFDFSKGGTSIVFFKAISL